MPPSLCPLIRRPRSRALCTISLALGAALVSCTGGLRSPSGPLENDPVDDGGSSELPDAGQAEPGASPLRCDATAPVDPGPTPLHLLSREQYLNTLRDLFGSAGDVRQLLGSASEPSEFGLLQADVSQVELEDFQRAAAAIANKVVADAALLTRLAPCSGSDKRACARSFVERVASRAYRSPLTEPDDVDKHLKLYDLGAKTSHERGLSLVLQGILQAPRFLYRVELGSGEQLNEHAERLSDYEVAARLSYVFWKTLPDEILTQAAAAGELRTPEQVAAQLERMLKDAKGKPALRQFLEDFMHLARVENLVKDPAVYPEWQAPSFRSAVAEQARVFFEHVLAHEQGSLAGLFTSTTVPINEQLAGLYGVSAGPNFTPVIRDDGHTAGLFSLPAFLAIQAKPDESSPIYRGKFVREALLCEQLPAPPPNIPKPPEVSAGVSSRDRAQQHASDPACSGCHQLLDPIGFGFENFDGIGRFRSDDGGRPVDARGEVKGSRDANGDFEGVVELGTRLSGSAQVRECLTRQWFRFAVGRFEQRSDDCAIERLSDAFAAQNDSLHALPRAIVNSAPFLYRRPIALEKP